ncbi:glycoside hydrolase family 19 protein [Rhodoligotrophos defluvii]|uniref:glycoside hydrolase family 19 protein n=1 Tax=Rhodoligotrophos defluvii TaxID=2561934 RepID=UPI0010C98CAF|nr:glycoside hydrolase family 19 protein [Rhodoligotrophos defluvii]
MTINRETFFAYVRRAPFGGRLTQQQVDGLSAILSHWEAWSQNRDIRWLANMLAQVHHETGGRFAPVREGFAGSDKAARKIVARRSYGKAEATGQVYYGRGLIQLTWLKNYKRMGDLLGVDLVNAPDLALDLDVSIRILFEGMAQGLFTGKGLGDYFNATTDDPIGARRVVNGTDKAKLIAGYHKNFLDALRAAQAAVIPPADVSPAAAEPDGPPLVKDTTIWTGIASAAGGLLTGVLGALDNPWALAGFGIVVVALVVLVIKRKDLRYRFGA